MSSEWAQLPKGVLPSMHSERPTYPTSPRVRVSTTTDGATQHAHAQCSSLLLRARGHERSTCLRSRHGHQHRMGSWTLALDDVRHHLCLHEGVVPTENRGTCACTRPCVSRRTAVVTTTVLWAAVRRWLVDRGWALRTAASAHLVFSSLVAGGRGRRGTHRMTDRGVSTFLSW